VTSPASIVFWIILFAATHMGLSSMRVRTRIVSAIGEPAFLGLYTVVAFATFGPQVRAWLGGIHGGGLLWDLRGVPGVHQGAFVVSWVSFALAIASFFQPSPAALAPVASKRAHGILRITRHPLFMNIGIWALAHVVVNGFVNDVLFFGGVFLVGLSGCMHQDARKQITARGTLDEFYAETSLLPFAAIATGRNRLVLSELPWLGIVIGAAISIVIYRYHARLFF
jgi:uncharacterized membrane protein